MATVEVDAFLLAAVMSRLESHQEAQTDALQAIMVGVEKVLPTFILQMYLKLSAVELTPVQRRLVECVVSHFWEVRVYENAIEYDKPVAIELSLLVGFGGSIADLQVVYETLNKIGFMVSDCFGERAIFTFKLPRPGHDQD